MSQASLAVANAASILSDSDTDEKEFSRDMTGRDLSELQQSKLAVSSLQEELESLKSQNSSLRSELTALVSHFKKYTTTAIPYQSPEYTLTTIILWNFYSLLDLR